MENLAEENFLSSKSGKVIVVKNAMFYVFLKRIIDMLGSILGLLLLLPLILIIAIIIKIEDSNGPVFFSQKRVGKNGKEFKMYKFRSMVFDAESRLDDLIKFNEIEGAMFKMKDDPRVTKVGKFIRRTSIDELPQLLNVLIGDMSLVGPRPPLLREVNQYNSYEKQRLMVKPGCTGLWQVTARNSVGFKEMVELDILYIQNRSTVYDMYLLIKTIIVLFGSKNAY